LIRDAENLLFVHRVTLPFAGNSVVLVLPADAVQMAMFEKVVLSKVWEVARGYFSSENPTKLVN
jgi:hypothetical protein